MKSVSALLVTALLACTLAGVSCHTSARLRHIAGHKLNGGQQLRGGDSNTRAVSLAAGTTTAGTLTCPRGQTLRIAGLDTAQNPGCVACGSLYQFCCNGSTCGAGLKCLQSTHVVQPVCVQSASFKLRKAKRTARGKNLKHAGNNQRVAATVSVTKDVGCGLPGWQCCNGNTCSLGAVCQGHTCIPSLNWY